MKDRELKIKEDACFLTDNLNTISVSENGILPIYDVCSAIVDYGKITAEANHYYSKIGYPVSPAKVEKGMAHCHYTSYEIQDFIPEFGESYSKLTTLRDSQHPFFQQKEIRDFFGELEYRCTTGQYITYKSPKLNEMKKTLLTEVPAVAYEVWMNQQNLDPFLEDRISRLQDTYATFKEIVDIPDDSEMVYLGSAGVEYAGPQFGRQLEGLFRYMTAEKQDVSSHVR